VQGVLEFIEQQYNSVNTITKNTAQLATRKVHVRSCAFCSKDGHDMIKCLKFRHNQSKKEKNSFKGTACALDALESIMLSTAERKLHAIDAPKDTTAFFMKTENAVSTAIASSKAKTHYWLQLLF